MLRAGGRKGAHLKCIHAFAQGLGNRARKARASSAEALPIS
jgi:hypothetical protein